MHRSTLLTLLLLTTITPLYSQTPQSALATLVHDYWEDNLRRSPEFASAIGDLRYNDQLSDLSPSTFNDRLASEGNFLQRLLLIDTTKLPKQDRATADLLQRELIDDQQAASFKQWELPINQSHSIPTDLAALVPYFPFSTVKDYDDFIARLHLIPRQLRQASENLLAGIQDRRVEPASLIQTALKQTDQLASQQPTDSPFAEPLQDFPAAIDPAQRKRISAAVLDAIQTDVEPAYVRLAKFLRVTELPAASTTDAVLPDHPLSYQLSERKLVELRNRAESAVGSKFDLKAFHDQVIGTGALPTDVLEQRTNAWIKSRTATTR